MPVLRDFSIEGRTTQPTVGRELNRRLLPFAAAVRIDLQSAAIEAPFRKLAVDVGATSGQDATGGLVEGVALVFVPGDAYELATSAVTAARRLAALYAIRGLDFLEARTGWRDAHVREIFERVGATIGPYRRDLTDLAAKDRKHRWIVIPVFEVDEHGSRIILETRQGNAVKDARVLATSSVPQLHEDLFPVRRWRWRGGHVQYLGRGDSVLAEHPQSPEPTMPASVAAEVTGPTEDRGVDQAVRKSVGGDTASGTEQPPLVSLGAVGRRADAVMSDESFWTYISRLDWVHEGDDDRVVEPVVRELAAKGVDEIQAFLNALAWKLFAMDGRAWARNSTAWWGEPDRLSTDEFLYERCVAVANGREFYEAVLADPARMPTNLEFEALLGIPHQAYERVTGRESDLVPAVSYETFANSAGWPAARKTI